MARTPTKTTLAKNLRYLMDRRHWKQKNLEAKTGVSQKTISNILNQKKVPGLDILDKIAEAFGLTSWHLITVTLIDELERGGSTLQTLHDNYVKASAKGRDFIQTVAEREADIHSKDGTKG